MVNDFRALSALTALSALLVLLGFYLTNLPIIAQVVLLFAGVATGIYTLIGIIRLLITFPIVPIAMKLITFIK